MTRGSKVRVAAALAATAAALVSSTASAAPLTCGEVPYTPGTTVASSSYGAKSVRADGVACPTARRLALRAKNRGAFTHLGFSCTFRSRPADKAWRCGRTQPRAVVTFLTVGN